LGAFLIPAIGDGPFWQFFAIGDGPFWQFFAKKVRPQWQKKDILVDLVYLSYILFNYPRLVI